MVSLFAFYSPMEGLSRGNHMFNHVQQDCCEATRPTVSNRTSRFLSLTAAIVLIAQSTGCVSSPGGPLDSSINGYRNHVWANRAFNLRYGNCDHEYSDHFKQGFIDGYCDVCDGGDGYVPAVPPEDYWSYQYQSAQGAKCVNAWFKSYPLGVKAAREDGAGDFQKVYISKMIKSAIVQEKADHVLPDDVPVVAPEKDVARKLPPNPFGYEPDFDAVTVDQNNSVNPNTDPTFRK